jgi:hypothetical protein
VRERLRLRLREREEREREEEAGDRDRERDRDSDRRGARRAGDSERDDGMRGASACAWCGRGEGGVLFLGFLAE